MRYAEIKYPDTANGLGVRVSLWLQGCSHHCKGCFNPETWDSYSGFIFTKRELYAIEELLKSPYVSGLSVLGGEPFDQWMELEQILEYVKKYFPSKDIWLWTGYLWEDVKYFPIMKYIDVLVDGEFIESEKDITLKFRGSRNQRLIDVRKSLEKGEVVLYECD